MSKILRLLSLHCYLQEELLYVAEEFQIPELNLLDSFIPEDLELLALRSNQLEQVIREIRAKYHQEGKKIGELASEYNLSTDSIRRILYK